MCLIQFTEYRPNNTPSTYSKQESNRKLWNAIAFSDSLSTGQVSVQSYNEFNWQYMQSITTSVSFPYNYFTTPLKSRE